MIYSKRYRLIHEVAGIVWVASVDMTAGNTNEELVAVIVHQAQVRRKGGGVWRVQYVWMGVEDYSAALRPFESPAMPFHTFLIASTAQASRPALATLP